LKGIIINILEDFIAEKFGDKTLEETYEQVELSDGIPLFLGSLNYPDQDLLGIFEFLSKKAQKCQLEMFDRFL